MSHTSSFQSFPRLPLELRLRILYFALPPTQLISFVAYSVADNSSLLHLPHYENAPDIWHFLYLERCSTLSIKQAHPLLHTSHETRSLVLSHHYLLAYKPQASITSFTKSSLPNQGLPLPVPPRDNEPRTSHLEPCKLKALNQKILETDTTPFTLFNPRRHIIFLADPTANHYLYSSLSVMIRGLHPSVLSSIRTLALSYYTWRKDRKFKLLPLLYEFGSLEKLYVCFVGNVDDWDGNSSGRASGGGWLDAVRIEGDETDTMLKQVEKEVLEDIEELLRGRHGWKKPVVRVVKDREALVKDWEGRGAEEKVSGTLVSSQLQSVSG